MHPVICQIGPLPIYSFGVMLAVAAFICSFLLQKEAARRGFDSQIILDLFFWVVVSGIIGSRLFYIFLNFDSFLNNPSEIFKLNHGGLAWQGGLILGTLTALFLVKKKKLPLNEISDLLAPFIALGQAIGRVGCFLNGCCYGKEVSWGIYFPVHHARLHPTQLYDALGLLIIFFVLKKYEATKKKPGSVFILYLILASSLRFMVEFFRADHDNFFFNLSVFQVVCLCIIMAAIYAKKLFLKS